MAYPEWLKIQSVRILQNSRSAQQASSEINTQFGLSVSARSIQLWARDSKIVKAAGGTASLFVENNIQINKVLPTTGQKFNIQEFVEKNKALFEESNQELDTVLKVLYKSITSEALVEMDIKDKLNAITKIEKLKIAKFNFLLAVIARSADDEDDLVELAGAMAQALNGTAVSKALGNVQKAEAEAGNE